MFKSQTVVKSFSVILTLNGNACICHAKKPVSQFELDLNLVTGFKLLSFSIEIVLYTEESKEMKRRKLKRKKLKKYQKNMQKREPTKSKTLLPNKATDGVVKGRVGF